MPPIDPPPAASEKTISNSEGAVTVTVPAPSVVVRAQHPHEKSMTSHDPSAMSQVAWRSPRTVVESTSVSR